MHLKFILQISSVDTPKVQIFLNDFPCSMSCFLALDLPCPESQSRIFDAHLTITMRQQITRSIINYHCWRHAVPPRHGMVATISLGFYCSGPETA